MYKGQFVVKREGSESQVRKIILTKESFWVWYSINIWRGFQGQQGFVLLLVQPQLANVNCC